MLTRAFSWEWTVIDFTLFRNLANFSLKSSLQFCRIFGGKFEFPFVALNSSKVKYDWSEKLWEKWRVENISWTDPTFNLVL